MINNSTDQGAVYTVPSAVTHYLHHIPFYGMPGEVNWTSTVVLVVIVVH